MTVPAVETGTARLAALDHAHVWHPFTPMRQWRERRPIIIERGEGFELIDTDGRRYIDGYSSLWCNVHGHRVPVIDAAIRDQLERIAHATMLGAGTVPAIELAGKLVSICNAVEPATPSAPLNKVFYTDAGATAVEVALKMAAGFHYHRGERGRDTFLAVSGGYHGDTIGAVSVGFLPAMHAPFERFVFNVRRVAGPDPRTAQDNEDDFRSDHKLHGGAQHHGSESRATPDSGSGVPPVHEQSASGTGVPPVHEQSASGTGVPPVRNQWPTLNERRLLAARDRALESLDEALEEVGGRAAAIIIEPIMQGAGGMIAHPPGYLAGVVERCRSRGALVIADEVATGVARTGAFLACDHERVRPDILCLAKGLTGGYLPLAATLCTDEIAAAFEGELSEHKTLYHGHTYTGNPLAGAAAIASLDLIDKRGVVAHASRLGGIIRARLRRELADHPNVGDVRSRGVMTGIELVASRDPWTPFEPAARIAARVCDHAIRRGVMIRPLGDVVVLNPAPAMDEGTLDRMLGVVIESIRAAVAEIRPRSGRSI